VLLLDRFALLAGLGVGFIIGIVLLKPKVICSKNTTNRYQQR
jgi:hypothetical protein